MCLGCPCWHSSIYPAECDHLFIMHNEKDTPECALASTWNLSTQTPHGGQDWRFLPVFVEDFSVTTNGLGIPKTALIAAQAALASVHHYPTSNGDPAWTSLAKFLLGDSGSNQTALLKFKNRLLLGNGASELIELCIRLSPGDSWRPGPALVQYKEYERAATTNNKRLCAWNDTSAKLLCIVNPCNPTGDFKSVPEMQEFINTYCIDNTTVIVDESMQPWIGPDWRNQSLISQRTWIEELLQTKNIRIFIIHSWTKLWACPGLRVGSVITPSSDDANTLRMHQVPWSMNSLAIAFLDSVVQDDAYLHHTWELTPNWRQSTYDAIQKLHPDWKFYGAPFLPFIWIDTQNEKIAQECVKKSHTLGVPIRWGLHGYKHPTCVRIAVRPPHTKDSKKLNLNAQLPTTFAHVGGVPYKHAIWISPAATLYNQRNSSNVINQLYNIQSAAPSPPSNSLFNQYNYLTTPQKCLNTKHVTIMKNPAKKFSTIFPSNISVARNNPVNYTMPIKSFDRQFHFEEPKMKFGKPPYISKTETTPTTSTTHFPVKIKNSLYNGSPSTISPINIKPIASPLLPQLKKPIQQHPSFQTSQSSHIQPVSTPVISNINQDVHQHPLQYLPLPSVKSIHWDTKPYNFNWDTLQELSLPHSPLSKNETDMTHFIYPNESPVPSYINSPSLQQPVRNARLLHDPPDPVGFSLDMLPVPCTYLRLPWPPDQPYCRLMPTPFETELSHTNDQTINSNNPQTHVCHLLSPFAHNKKTSSLPNVPNSLKDHRSEKSESSINKQCSKPFLFDSHSPHILIVKRMVVEKISSSPSAYLIRYVYSPSIHQLCRQRYQDTNNQHPDPLSLNHYNKTFINYSTHLLSSRQDLLLKDTIYEEDDLVVHELFQRSQIIFNGSRILGLGFSPSGVIVSNTRSSIVDDSSPEDVCLIYFRLKLHDLPFSRKQLERDWEKRRNDIRSSVSAVVIIFDYRFSDLASTLHPVYNNPQTTHYKWSHESMRRIVHLTAQTHSILDSWLINNLEGRELNIIHLPPPSFSTLIDSAIINGNNKMGGDVSQPPHVIPSPMNFPKRMSDQQAIHIPSVVVTPELQLDSCALQPNELIISKSNLNQTHNHQSVTKKIPTSHNDSTTHTVNQYNVSQLPTKCNRFQTTTVVSINIGTNKIPLTYPSQTSRCVSDRQSKNIVTVEKNPPPKKSSNDQHQRQMMSPQTVLCLEILPKNHRLKKKRDSQLTNTHQTNYSQQGVKRINQHHCKQTTIKKNDKKPETIKSSKLLSESNQLHSFKASSFSQIPPNIQTIHKHYHPSILPQYTTHEQTSLYSPNKNQKDCQLSCVSNDFNQAIHTHHPDHSIIDNISLDDPGEVLFIPSKRRTNHKSILTDVLCGACGTWDAIPSTSEKTGIFDILNTSSSVTDVSNNSNTFPDDQTNQDHISSDNHLKSNTVLWKTVVQNTTFSSSDTFTTHDNVSIVDQSLPEYKKINVPKIVDLSTISSQEFGSKIKHVNTLHRQSQFVSEPSLTDPWLSLPTKIFRRPKKPIKNSTVSHKISKIMASDSCWLKDQDNTNVISDRRYRLSQNNHIPSCELTRYLQLENQRLIKELKAAKHMYKSSLKENQYKSIIASDDTSLKENDLHNYINPLLLSDGTDTMKTNSSECSLESDLNVLTCVPPNRLCEDRQLLQKTNKFTVNSSQQQAKKSDRQSPIVSLRTLCKWREQHPFLYIDQSQSENIISLASYHENQESNQTHLTHLSSLTSNELLYTDDLEDELNILPRQVCLTYSSPHVPIINSSSIHQLNHNHSHEQTDSTENYNHFRSSSHNGNCLNTGLESSCSRLSDV